MAVNDNDTYMYNKKIVENRRLSVGICNYTSYIKRVVHTWFMGRQLYNYNEDSFNEIGFDIQLIDKQIKVIEFQGILLLCW